MTLVSTLAVVFQVFPRGQAFNGRLPAALRPLSIASNSSVGARGHVPVVGSVALVHSFPADGNGVLVAIPANLTYRLHAISL